MSSMSSVTHRWSYSPRLIRSIGRTHGDRHVITRDTTICGGIDTYDEAVDAPAIVVDPAKYPDAYQRLLREVVGRAESGRTVMKRLLLSSVFNTVMQNMQYSESGERATEARVAATHYGTERIPRGGKIELSEYINDGAGVCREQALTVGALIEMLGERRFLNGVPRIHRNIEEDSDNPDSLSGHQWVRYTSYSQTPYILDVAAHFYGTLDQAIAEGRFHYLLPEELKGGTT